MFEGLKMKIDYWFKPIIIILAIIFLIIFYQYSQNGRYTYHKYGKHSYIYLIDSQKGIIYAYEGGQIVFTVNFPAHTIRKNTWTNFSVTTPRFILDKPVEPQKPSK